MDLYKEINIKGNALIKTLILYLNLLLMPNKLFIWPLPMVMAAAVVNAVVTGTEINLTNTPRFKKPNIKMTHPERKHNNTA